MVYFVAGVAIGAAGTRRSRRMKEAARAALAAKLTPSAVAADVADAVAELGNAVGSFASDVRQGAANRRAAYRPMIDGVTGSVALLAPDQIPSFVGSAQIDVPDAEPVFTTAPRAVAAETGEDSAAGGEPERSVADRARQARRSA